jgi:hypothetical protein
MAKAQLKTDYELALDHKYRVMSGGDVVPGVTTVVKACTPIYALPYAAAKIAAQTAIDLTMRGDMDLDIVYTTARTEHDRVWKDKASRGTRVHDVAERWTRGESVDVPLSDEGFVDALEEFHKKYQPKFSSVESVVLNFWSEYGGRIDGIAEFDGGRYLLDWKTGAHYPYEVALQMAAYLEARIAEYDEEGNLVDIGAAPLAESVDGARVIYLCDDGTFNVVNPFEAVSQADATMAFGACLQLYKINQRIQKGIRDAERINQ